MAQIDIWNFTDYKAFIKASHAAMENGGRGQLKKLAEALGVHSTLMSQVINGPKDFSDEQALKVAVALQLTEAEIDYFLQLVFYSKAGTVDLRAYHLNKLSLMSENAQTVSGRVGKAKELTEDDKIRYYSDWSFVGVWLATSLEQMKDPQMIADELGIPRNRVLEILEFLVSKNLCGQTKGGYKMGLQKIHVPASSPLSKNHHVNWRLKSLDFVQDVKKSELAFTAPISISVKDFEKIKKMILKLIEDISEVVSETEPEVLACLNFDQFLIKR